MLFEWDEAKDAANRAKHGIGFDRAVRVFSEPSISYPAKAGIDGEARTVTIGLIEDLLIAAVVHTDRQGVIRLISARPASRKERRLFHGTHGARET